MVGLQGFLTQFEVGPVACCLVAGPETISWKWRGR